MSGPELPLSQHVVAALWQRGEVRAAAAFASNALARCDPHRHALHAQLDRLRAGEALTDIPAQMPALDHALVTALVDRYRFHEAQCVLSVVGATSSRSDGLERLLTEALAPFPADADPSFDAVLHLVRAGQAPSALRALEGGVEMMPSPPGWMTERRHAIGRLVCGGWWTAPESVGPATAATVLERLRAHDLPGALRAAQEAGAQELATNLSRLAAEARREYEAEPGEDGAPGTLPMEGLGLASFHVRMGMLAQAEAVLRAWLAKDEGCERGRLILADVLALRAALGERVDPLPPRRRLSVYWLSKKKPRRPAKWAGAVSEPYPTLAVSELDETTEVLDAAQEAELLLRLGKAEEALAIYRILATRHRSREHYRRRIEEIGRLLVERGAPVAAEVTANHDLDALRVMAVPTDPSIRRDLPACAVQSEQDEGSTLRLRPHPWEK